MSAWHLKFRLAVLALAAAVLLTVIPITITFSSFSATTSVRATFAAQSVFPADNLTTPSFSGIAQAGQKLTATPGTWSRTPSSYRYQWQRCPAVGQAACTGIASATASTYTVAPADAGYKLRLGVTAQNRGGDSATATSARSDEIPPALQSVPTISGLPAVGQSLTASPGTWQGLGDVYEYQWRRCDITGANCADIAGAVGPSYTPTPADLHFTIVAAVTATATGGPTANAPTFPTSPIAASVNPIVLENAKAGTTAWQIQGNPSTNIAGYTSEISVQSGDTLHIHVSTAGSARYRVEIYRLGWYGGAGGRLLTCIPSCTGDDAGTQYPVAAPDPTTGYLDAGWPVTDVATIGADWTSGYYLAKLVLASGSDMGGASYVPFIVRSSAGTSAAVLVQASVNTWEAYNNWGGKSLYAFNSTSGDAATWVSFNRPFAYIPVAQGGNTTPLSYEIGLVRFMEREGYDLTYQTDVDTDESPTSLLGHRLDVVNGHDEYWSPTMRSAWDSARDQGVNLAFLGADIGYWQLRYAAADRTLIEYRSASADPETDPSQKTTAFGSLNPPQPECELLGIAFRSGSESQSGAPNAGDYAVTTAAAANPWFQSVSLAAGAVLPGAVGYEWDGIEPGCSVPPLEDLLHWQTSGGTADAVLYQASSGARVFSDGTLSIDYLLDNYGWATYTEDSRVQRLFAGVLDGLGSG
jgi:hypothetical protein